MKYSLAAFILAYGIFTGFAHADHSWNGFHWARTQNPFTLTVGDSVSSAWDPYLQSAVTDWNASSVLDLVIVPSSKSKTCRPTDGRIEVCNAKYGSTGWLGIAQVWVSNSHITKATTKLNDTYFTQAKYNTPAWRRLVACQELAHNFGLDHQDEDHTNVNLGSCMDYTNNPSGPLSNEHPNAHDFEQIETMYAHLDTTTTIAQKSAQSTPALSRIDVSLDTPRDWGRAVRDSVRSSVYERDLGLGQKVYTHVFWIPEEGAEHDH